MPEAEITRKQIIVVNEVGTNTYGDLTFTDKDGGQYKIGTKRKPYFEKVIIPNMAVQLNYVMSSFGKEYIYNATQIKDELPTVKATHLTDKGELKPGEEMTKTDWSERDRTTRKSIERQTALKEATNIACAMIAQGKEMSPSKVIATAKLFEAYLEGKVTNRVVEAALKLGAEVVEDPE